MATSLTKFSKRQKKRGNYILLPTLVVTINISTEKKNVNPKFSKIKIQNDNRDRNLYGISNHKSACFMVTGKIKQELIADWDLLQKHL